MVDPPYGTVTFLFTDVEGSTQLLRKLGECYAGVLEEHLEVLRAATAAHGGREIDTQGDAYFAVFWRASDAVEAAVQAQRALGAHVWPDGSRLSVRMGVHSGEAAARRDRFVGLGVHRAARISAVGHGGQILVSEAARAAVRGEGPEGVSFRDLGRCRLKDFGRSQHVFQILAPGLRRDFPHLRTAAPSLRRRRAALLAAAAASAACAAAVVALLVHSATAPARVPANSVAIIDPRHARLLGTAVPVGVRPGALAGAGGSVWVANLDDNSVTRIGADSRQPLGTLTPGGYVSGLAAGAGSVWLADAARNVVDRLDPAVGTITGHTPATTGAVGLQSPDVPQPVAAGAGSVWVGQAGSVTRFDAATMRRKVTIPIGIEVTAIAVGAGATWVSDATENVVARIVNGRVRNRITTGFGPDAIAVGDGAVWVAERFDNSVARIDPITTRITEQIPVGSAPSAVTVIGHSVWVANSDDGTLSEINSRTGRVEHRLPVGDSPAALAAVGGQLWVSMQAPAADVVSPGSTSRGGVARVSLTGDPGSLDPALGQGWQILYATCAKLYNYPDAAGAGGARIVPEIARAMPAISPDGLRYTFTIRPGFRFSPPSNAPVTARTFRHVIERDVSPGWGPNNDPAADYLADVSGIGDYEKGHTRHISGVSASGNQLVIRLTRPAGDLPLRLSQPLFCAVPDDAPIRAGGISTLPMAGPYYVQSDNPGQQITLSRNPDYHGHRPARLSAIDVRIGAAPGASIARVTAGIDDYYPAPAVSPNAMSPAVTARLQRRYGAARGPAAQRFFVNETSAVNYFLLNTARPLFAHQRLRRAVNLAINHRALAATQGIFGPQRPTDQYLAPEVPGFRDVSLYPLNGDIAHARRLAGRTHHHANLLTCTTAPCPQEAAIVRADLAKIGIDTTIRRLPIEDVYKQDFQPGATWDIAFLSWTPNFPDPSDALSLLRYLGFNDPGYNRRLDAAALLSGPARYAAYAKLDADLAGKATPMVAFGIPLDRDYFSARMGCQIYQPTYGIDLAALCIKRSAHG